MTAMAAPAATIHVGNVGACPTWSSRCDKTSAEVVGFAPPSLLLERLRAGGLSGCCGKGLSHRSRWSAFCALYLVVRPTVAGGNTSFQSFFMLITVQPFCFASSYSPWVKVPTLLSCNPWAGP